MTDILPEETSHKQYLTHMPIKLWHMLTAKAVCDALKTGPDGLGEEEARRRLDIFGPNRLPEPPGQNPVLRFLAQFNNTLIYFLLSAAVAASVLSHIIDGIVIVVVVVVNAIIGFVQENKAEQALAAIRDMIAPHATVIRGGERRAMDARELVPGDVVALEAGDKVPADIRLLRARSLTADESILTGEAVPAGKEDRPVAAEAPLGDRFPMLYSGTLVTTGQATGIVVSTGPDSEIGRISGLIGNVQTLTTPLLQQINRFGNLFTWFAISVAVVLFVFAIYVRHYPWVDALMVVVALAVGVVPEGLPAVITITLAIGVRRMAARKAVVRRLPAVETLGSTSVICSDKTGTLTRNEMTARRIVTGSGVTEVSGGGYAPVGGLSPAVRNDAGEEPARNALLCAGLLCNDAVLVEKAGQWVVVGDPMEGALITLAAKAGLHPETARASWNRLDEIPFDAQHRFMATLHRSPEGERTIFVKGAPERVLHMCKEQAGPRGQETVDHAYWHQQINEAAAQGQRVLGFATRSLNTADERLDFGAVEKGLTFLGLVGFIDPPRDEAIEAVATCQRAGIAVKMITGDHMGTAIAIARQLGIAGEPKAVQGVALDSMSDELLQNIVEETDVFSRTTPEHKLRIVRALQKNGHIVAMTGDGVNDAPAVKQADVGVAMGLKGTEAAKEAAQMVLLDDNFASIVAAIHEGRTVYDNIRKVIGWTLPTNGAETLVVVFAIIFGLVLPMTPVQILWINMILTVTLGLVLAFEPSEPEVMRRPPRPRNEPILSRFLVWRVFFVSVLFMLGVFGIFHYAQTRGYELIVTRTLIVNAVVVMEIFYLFNVRYLHMSSFSFVGMKGTPIVLAAITVVICGQFAFTYAPVMQDIFETAPVSLFDGLVAIAMGGGLMIALEIEKIIIRYFEPRFSSGQRHLSP